MYGSFATLALVALSSAQGVNVYNAKLDGLSQHTIYMPSTKGKFPVLVWSSGGCIGDGICSSLIRHHYHVPISSVGGAQHGPALKEAASHGIMIIALGTTEGGKFGGFPGASGGAKGGPGGFSGEFSLPGGGKGGFGGGLSLTSGGRKVSVSEGFLLQNLSAVNFQTMEALEVSPAQAARVDFRARRYREV